MARTNVAQKLPPLQTHEGGPAVRINAREQLRRAVMSCLLWENQFYVDGVEIAERIEQNAKDVSLDDLAQTALDARQRFHLRHVPLLLAVVLAGRAKEVVPERRGGVADVIANVVDRVDEAAELCALYWKRNPNKMLPHQMRLGLARALSKFDAYQFGKYSHNKGDPVKLRDVFRIARPKPASPEQAALWGMVVKGTVPAPDTWEVALMRGADKKETFTRLLEDGKLGYLALLRNLRNMEQSGVDRDLVGRAIEARKGAERVFPFRFVAAAKAAPQYEPFLDKALTASVEARMGDFAGRTIVLVDISGSMDAALSSKSDMRRLEAAATLASIFPGRDVRVFSFSNDVKEVPRRVGMAGVEAIIRSQSHGGTMLGHALTRVNREKHDRVVVITDEQTADRVPLPEAQRAYMINVASYQNGVGYKGDWVHLDGFSEAVLRWMAEYEKEES